MSIIGMYECIKFVATAGPKGRTFDLCADMRMSVGIEKLGSPGFHVWFALLRMVVAGRGRETFRCCVAVWNGRARTRSWRRGRGGMVVSLRRGLEGDKLLEPHLGGSWAMVRQWLRNDPTGKVG